MNRQRQIAWCVALLGALTIIASAGLCSSQISAPDSTTQPATSQRASSHDAAVRDISELLKPICEKHHIPGMTAAVIHGDTITAIGAAGVREHDHPQSITINDIFHIGSCTKAMTATMIATLVEEGKLKWSTTIGEVFTDLADTMNPQWKDVTLAQLLTHRAGVPAHLSADGLWGRLWNASDKPPTEQRRMLLEGVLSKPPVHGPGTKYLYANAGFAIAGAMAEQITGQSWEALMQERLFQPLGMTSAGFGAPGSKDTIDQPRGHRADGKAIMPGFGADNPAAIGPGGTVHCTIDDWAKFISLHLKGERGDTAILKHDSFIMLHTPYESKDDTKYAMGWMITTRPWARLNNSTGRVFTHSGSNTMWYCVAWLAPPPERDFAVLVMCNQGGDEAAKGCDEAAAALIQDDQAAKGK